jgi:hypothetical protein
MTESEEGEWVRYGEYKEIVELVSMERDSYRELYREEQFSKWEAMGLAEHLNYRVHVLNIILMATYGGIVAKLIGWSLGL